MFPRAVALALSFSMLVPGAAAAQSRAPRALILDGRFQDAAAWQRALDLPLAELGLTEPAPPITPPTCRRYLELARDGYYHHGPTIEAPIPADLLRTCGALELLVHAAPRARSWLRRFDLRRSFSELPAIDVWRGAPAPGLLRDQRPWALGRETVDRLSLWDTSADAADHSGMTLQTLGFGDIDGDGYEDVILEARADSGGASVDFAFALVVVTRRSRQGPLEIARIIREG